jgi:putative N6-adenine-specific DNA methylase
MNQLQLFLPCAGGVETYLAQEVRRILSQSQEDGSQVREVREMRGGVQLQASWREALELNLWSRLANRVLIQVMQRPYRPHDDAQDIYDAAYDVPWEIWFTAQQTFKIDLAATRSPLKSLNFAALRIKDALCDRFRAKAGSRPSVDTQRPQVRVHAHLSSDQVSLYIDTSGEPLFKRGWRQDKGDAPLKETLAAAMLAACGWWKLDAAADEAACNQPLYDPCCGSGTIVIEAAQIALGIAPGSQRRFGFERLLPYQAHVWSAIKNIAKTPDFMPTNGHFSSQNGSQSSALIYGSDVAHRMVDFAQRNAELAGVAQVVQLRGGDALQRKPPCDVPPQGAVILTNPPYGERIEIAGVAGRNRSDSLSPRERVGVRATRPAREIPQTEDNEEASNFFPQLATHWKTHFDGWSAWLLVPDMKLPGKMRMKETRRVPLWNGPIECRLFRFDIQARINPSVNPAPSSAT